MSIGTIGFSSCSDDEEATIDAPAEFFKTWYLNSHTTITFRSNGTGVITGDDSDLFEAPATSQLLRNVGRRNTTRAQISVEFTYSYDASSKKLVLNSDEYDEQVTLYVENVTDNKLTLKDEDGYTITLSDTPTAIPPTTDEIYTKEQLMGQWGFCNIIHWEVKENELIWHGDGVNETLSYTLSNNIIHLKESDGAAGDIRINRITDEYIWFTILGDPEDPAEVFFFKMEKDGNTVGNAALLYDKKWITAPGVENICIEFHKNGTATFKSDLDGEFSVSATYNAGTKEIKMAFDGEETVYNVIKLTANTLILNHTYFDGGYMEEETIEFRILD